MGSKTREMWSDANLFSDNFMCCKLCLPNFQRFESCVWWIPLCIFLLSKPCRSLRKVTFWWSLDGRPGHPLPRLDQKVLSRLAECDDVIKEAFFSLALAHPALSPHHCLHARMKIANMILTHVVAISHTLIQTKGFSERECIPTYFSVTCFEDVSFN